MSNLKRIDEFNARNTGTLLHNSDGTLVIDMPGDEGLTTHQRVQYDLGPISGTFASWCLDALLGEIKTAATPNATQKGQIFAMTRCSYPEKPVVAEVAEDKAPSKKV